MDSLDVFQSLLGRIVLRARANGLDPPRGVELGALELRVLAMLVFDGPVTMKHLGVSASLPRSSMTDVVDRLAAKQLLVRATDSRDTRQVRLEATNAARFTLLQATAGFAPLAVAMLSQLTESETEDLLRLLGRAVEGLF